MDRFRRESTVSGYFGLPVGIQFLSRDHGRFPDKVVISTVQLDGAFKEDPLKLCSPETGYETMVFLDGCTFFSIYTAKYATEVDANLGHDSVIERLMDGTLPLAIPVRHYHAFESSEIKEPTKI